MRNGVEPCRRRAPRGALPALVALLLLVAGCGVASGGTAAPRATTRPRGTPTPVHLPVQYAPTPTPLPPELAPVRLLVPKMGLDAPIMSVGTDASGAMVAPRAADPRDPIWSAVYWWDLGVQPGQVGNAVIAGHVNRIDASPSTFTRLNWLAPGDHIQVVTAGGQSLTFVVTSKETPLIAEHDPGDPAFIRVFGPSLTPNLNLITCWGDWIGNTFDRRLVVHSTLVGPSPFGDVPTAGAGGASG
jgi:hypothetical protein